MVGNMHSMPRSFSHVEKNRSLFVTFRGDCIDEFELNISEPSRLFASYLIGKDPREAPAVFENLWGKCPVSYQIPACEALEAAMGVQVTPEIRRLRRLFYCGEWIESHVQAIHLLAPDFVGGQIVSVNREVIEHCLRLRQVGESLAAALSGSATHPIKIAVGGFDRAPRAYVLAELRPDLEWAVEAAVEILRFLAALDFPKVEIEYVDYEMVCLHHASRYPMNEGHVISSRGLVVPVSQYEAYFSQRDLIRSAMIQSVRMPCETSYLVGPLARVNMSLYQLAPTARREAEACGVKWPSGNIFHSIMARAIELIHACEEAIAIVDWYQRDLTVPQVNIVPKPGKGCYAAEVPSGLMYHRYRVNSQGRIADAKIVSPGAQNQKQAEQDLRAYLPRLGGCDNVEATRRCEQFVRNYDPGPGGSISLVSERNE